MKRRQLLAALSAGAVPLAGCLGSGDASPGDEDDNEPGGDESGLDVTRLTTVATDCGDPDDDWVRASLEGASVEIQGTTPAPHPCHEVILGATSMDDGVLSVGLDVTATLGEDEDCAQCHGAVAYELSIDPTGEDIEEIRVDHAHGEVHTVTPGADDEAEPALLEIEIATGETGCAGPDDRGVALSRSEGELVIDGVRPAPTPCYHATLAGATLRDRDLTIEVGLESYLDEGEMCVQCLGRIGYRVTVEVEAADAIETVTVDHVDAGTHVLTHRDGG